MLVVKSAPGARTVLDRKTNEFSSEYSMYIVVYLTLELMGN